MPTPSRAPEISPNYPTSYPRVAKAWSACWDLLDAGHWLAGPELAHAGAIQLDPPLDDHTVRTVLRRAVAAGLLERDARSVRGDRGDRTVAFYRRADR